MHIPLRRVWPRRLWAIMGEPGVASVACPPGTFCSYCPKQIAHKRHLHWANTLYLHVIWRCLHCTHDACKLSRTLSTCMCVITLSCTEKTRNGNISSYSTAAVHEACKDCTSKARPRDWHAPRCLPVAAPTPRQAMGRPPKRTRTAPF